jgi:hypothetical protein
LAILGSIPNGQIISSGKDDSMGITMITALEIFTNPSDLEISIIQEKDGDRKFAICISRGPGHDFKLLLTSQPFAKTCEDAVKVVRETLEAVSQVATNELENKENFVSHVINPGGEQIDKSCVLNPVLINRIIDELRLNQITSTYKMLALAG